jgi:hypothetical protein
MKITRLLLITLILCSFSACKVGVASKSGGMDNQSYLQFIQGGSRSYGDGVTAYVDDNPAFTAKVDVPKRRSIKGNSYVIKPGTRHVKVVSNGQTLYEKDVVIGNQETKKIVLP